MEHNTTTRYYYIDNLRVTAIMLVILMHLAVTYSNFGLWYFNEVRPLGFFSHIFFGVFQSFLQGFFMGMLFLVAGYFTPGAYDRKGFGRFIADRCRRLGLPSLLYLLAVTPFICWVEVPGVWTGSASSFPAYYRQYIMSAGMNLLGFGPMWFAIALLIFSIIYAMLRKIWQRDVSIRAQWEGGSFNTLLVLFLLIAVTAFFLRLVFPIGTIFWGMQLCFFAQYVVLFIAGIFAYRTNFLEGITSATGKKWLLAGLIIGSVGWLTMKWISGLYDFSTHTINPNTGSGSFGGGISWKSFSFALWESFVAVSMTIGLLALFRDKFNYCNSFTQKLSDSAFAVYMFHPPIIIAVTLAMQTLAILPVFKWATASLISVPLCFLLAYYFLLRAPLLNKIL
jgi:glucans biosynthesis protein C